MSVSHSGQRPHHVGLGRSSAGERVSVGKSRAAAICRSLGQSLGWTRWGPKKDSQLSQSCSGFRCRSHWREPVKPVTKVYQIRAAFRGEHLATKTIASSRFLDDERKAAVESSTSHRPAFRSHDGMVRLGSWMRAVCAQRFERG